MSSPFPLTEAEEFELLADLIDGTGRVGRCSCGYPVVEFDGQLFHAYNDQWTGTDDHDPELNDEEESDGTSG